jgi:hypothetical protein
VSISITILVHVYDVYLSIQGGVRDEIGAH